LKRFGTQFADLPNALPSPAAARQISTNPTAIIGSVNA
jgi:hypothetical protein